MFPHLSPSATWTEQNNAGTRMRAVYEAGRASRLASVGLPDYDGRTIVCADPVRGTYTIGLDYSMSMARCMIVHRAMARNGGPDRRHHVENALRIRGALCWGGLSANRRTATPSAA